MVAVNGLIVVDSVMPVVACVFVGGVVLDVFSVDVTGDVVLFVSSFTGVIVEYKLVVIEIFVVISVSGANVFVVD